MDAFEPLVVIHSYIYPHCLLARFVNAQTQHWAILRMVEL